MRLALTGAIVAAALAGAAAPAEAASIDLRRVTARVTIVPQARPDVQVVMLKTNPRIPLRVYRSLGGDMVVADANWMDWLFWNLGTSCARSDGHLTPSRLGAPIPYEDLPQIVVYTPMDARVQASGAIEGVVGHADSLTLMSGGCGQWTLADVKNDLNVDSAGWNEIRGGQAGRMFVRIAGSASIDERGAARGLEVDIAGSGAVRIGAASGPVSVHIAGGGDVDIAGGHATSLATHIAGSGDIRYEGVADEMDAGIAGSGQISVAKVTGPVHKTVTGSGAIDVGP